MTHFRVSGIVAVTPTIFQLTLAQVAGGNAFVFEPGQYAAINFRRFGRRVPVRCFSIASSPTSPGTIQFGIKIKGRFTRTLSSLKVGDPVEVAGPFGSFTLAGKPAKPTLLLAGGIGITPFLSMIRHAAATGSPQPITLVYSVRNASEAAYAIELAEITRQLPNFRAVLQLSRPLDPGARLPLPAVIGPLTPGHLAKVNRSDLQVFICGPSGYMESMQTVLAKHGVAQHAIYTESFQQAAPLLEENPRLWQRLPLAYVGSAAALMLGVGLISYGDLKKTSAKYALAQAAVQSTSTTDTPAEIETESEEDDPTPTPTPVATPTSVPIASPTPARAAVRIATPVPTVATPAPTPIATQRPPRSQVS